MLEAERRMEFLGRQNIFVWASAAAHTTLNGWLSETSMFQVYPTPTVCLAGALVVRMPTSDFGVIILPPKI
jgi:hypothetical protein